MKVFAHLALLALLIQALARSQGNVTTSASSTTNITATTITSPTTTDTAAPSVANTSTTPPSVLNTSTTPPSVANTSTTPPTVANTSTTAPTVANTSTTAPTVANTSTTAPTVANTSTTAPTVANTSTTAPTVANTSPTPPSVANTSTTPPTVANTSTTPPTVANTSTTAPTVANTSTTAPTVANTSTTAPSVANTSTTAPTVANTSTTPPTVANTSTTPPTVANTSTTPPTVANTSTTAPTVANTSTTAPTVANTSTTAPTVANTSTTPSTVANTSTSTPTSPAGGTTPAPASNTSTSTTHTPGSSTPCKEDSCMGGSSCVNLHNDHFCLCSEGYYYNSSTCLKGKIFPGTIKVKISYTSELENKGSEAYQNLFIEVITFFKDTFNNSEYGQTVIVKVSISTSARSEMRAGNQGVDVAVVNIFTESTKQNETTISNAIRNAIKTQSNFSGYDQQDRCDYYGCKKPNGQNDCDSGLLCECKKGLVRPNPQIPMCVGPTCSDTCDAQSKKQCLVTSSGSADCVCMPGYKEDSQGKCQECPFGYSGVNCKDSFQLILTIVGTIAGVLILGMVITLIVSMRLKNKGMNVEEETLIEKDSQNLRLKETGFSNLGAEGSIFPKIKVNLPSQPENPYTRHGILPRPDY